MTQQLIWCDPIVSVRVTAVSDTANVDDRGSLFSGVNTELSCVRCLLWPIISHDCNQSDKRINMFITTEAPFDLDFYQMCLGCLVISCLTICLWEAPSSSVKRANVCVSWISQCRTQMMKSWRGPGKNSSGVDLSTSAFPVMSVCAFACESFSWQLF